MMMPKKVKFRKQQRGRRRGMATRGQKISFGDFFPDKPVTKKPLETRMGRGKGAPEEWVCVIKPARILYEMEGVTREVAEEAFRLAGSKLPLKTRFVSREMLEVAE